MDFIAENIQEYVVNHTSKEKELLYDLNRETHSKILNPRMLSGHLQGRLLSMFSKMIRPRRILEIGTYTGYSALCLSEGLAEDGKLFTIDINEELEEFTRNYFKKAEKEQIIEYIIGNAVEVIPELQEQWDLVFIDADKENYINYYELVLPFVRKGGIIVADNVLWSGKVLSKAGAGDVDTQGLQLFNTHVNNDNRVENVMLSIRDGLMVVCKK